MASAAYDGYLRGYVSFAHFLQYLKLGLTVLYINVLLFAQNINRGTLDCGNSQSEQNLKKNHNFSSEHCHFYCCKNCKILQASLHNVI